MMSVIFSPPIADVFCIPICNVLRAIPTFKDDFQDLTIKRKFIVLIADIGTDLSRINLEIHEYNLDWDAKLPTIIDSLLSLLLNTHILSTCTCTAFIEVVTKTKPIIKAVAKE